MIDLKGLSGIEIDRVKKAYEQGKADAKKKCTPIECENIYPSHQLECSECGCGFSYVGRNRGGVTFVEALNYNYCPKCGCIIEWKKEQTE